MLIVKCNKKISLFVQLFVCCDLFCLCADIILISFSIKQGILM